MKSPRSETSVCGGEGEEKGGRTGPNDGFEGVERTKMDRKVCVPVAADLDVPEPFSRVLDVRRTDEHGRVLDRDAAWE